MRLYQLPRGAFFTVCDDADTPPEGLPCDISGRYRLVNIDGMYSYCVDSNSNVYHISAYAEVELI